MPISFPDMQSLVRAAKCWEFRERHEGESEADYREALADHVLLRDRVESMEIRTGKGWDQFSEAEKAQMLRGGHK